MIRELTVKEIAVCHGSVRLVEYVYGNGDSTMWGIFAGTVTLWVCYGATGIAKTYVGGVVTALIIPAVVVATYRNYYGTKYIVDLDATAD